MQLPARDRRRLKDIPDVCAALKVNRGRVRDMTYVLRWLTWIALGQSDPYDTYINMFSEYYNAKQIKLPDIVPASAGGLNKTSERPTVSPLQS